MEAKEPSPPKSPLLGKVDEFISKDVVIQKVSVTEIAVLDEETIPSSVAESPEKEIKELPKSPSPSEEVTKPVSDIPATPEKEVSPVHEEVGKIPSHELEKEVMEAKEP